LAATEKPIVLLDLEPNLKKTGDNMKHHTSNRLIKNGAVAMLIGMAGGFGLIFAMIGGISLSPIPVFFELEILGSIQGWRMLHTGMLMNGMMAILLGLVLRFYVVSNLGVSVLGLGTITAIWGNFCFYLFGMFAPNHGVTTHANRLGDVNLPALLAFFPAFVGIFTLVAALIVVLCATPMDGSNVRAGNAS
jgi:hypothetical protein